MSADSPTSQRAPGFLWILAAFLGFVVVALVLQGWFGQDRTDPRQADRLANLDDVKALQATNVKKLGLEVAKSDERLAKALDALKALKPTTSAMLVPGSPTQLKQSAAPAPAPAAAPAAAKPAESPAAPAPAPAAAPAAPAPTPPPAAPAPVAPAPSTPPAATPAEAPAK